MPFTLSHPVFAIPLKYISPKHFSLTGLVLGSMSPDFEYFLMLEPYRSIGHSIPGMFLQAIPISVVLAFLFHLVVKAPLALHLPTVFKLNQRAYAGLSSWRLQHPRDWIVFAVSVIAGFLTHVISDAFTHASGYFVIYFPFLSAVHFGYPVYKLLQYGLSVIGLVILGWMILNRLVQANLQSLVIPEVTRRQRMRFWTTALIISALTTGLKIVFTSSLNIIGIAVVAPVSGMCLGILMASVVSSIHMKSTDERR